MTPSPSNTEQPALPTQAVHLTDDEAVLFVAFQKRRAFMELLESLDAFNIKGGTLTIHFDNLGGIGSVDVNRHYRLIPSP